MCEVFLCVRVKVDMGFMIIYNYCIFYIIRHDLKKIPVRNETMISYYVLCMTNFVVESVFRDAIADQSPTISDTLARIRFSSEQLNMGEDSVIFCHTFFNRLNNVLCSQ